MHTASANVTLNMQRKQLPRHGAASAYVVLTHDDWLTISDLLTSAQRKQIRSAEVEYVPFSLTD